MNLKEKIEEKIKNYKSIQPKSSRFNDIREELETFGYDDLKETIWNILNDFPEHICGNCNKETKFKSFQYGYKPFCNTSCSNKFNSKRNDVKNKISNSLIFFNKTLDKNYYNKRTEKMLKTIGSTPYDIIEQRNARKSINMINVHKNRSQEEKDLINKKISSKVKNSDKAKNQRIQRSKLGAKALNEYRKTLKEEELKLFNKRFGCKDIIKDKRKEFKEYTNFVWYFTNKNLHLIENIEKRSVMFHLDHKYSIKQGFLDNISAEIIGSCFNLEILSARDNCSKGSICSISKEELLSSFENLKIGDF